MRITYDEEVDAMYIQLVEREQECRTVRLTDEVALDFGEDEALVGIEILDAKKVLGGGKLPKLAVDHALVVGSAAGNGAGRAKPAGKKGRRSRQRARAG